MHKFTLAVTLLVLSGAVTGTSYLSANALTAKLGGELEFYHSDNLGSTRTITDEAAQVIEEQKALPFGGILEGDEKYGFTGKELDESGLQYFGARYYRPETGTFLSTDPALQYHSPYLYAGNNPLAYKDPDGNYAQLALLLYDLGIAFGLFQGLEHGPSMEVLTPPQIDRVLGGFEVLDDAMKVTAFIFVAEHFPFILSIFSDESETLNSLGGEQLAPPDLPDTSVPFAEGGELPESLKTVRGISPEVLRNAELIVSKGRSDIFSILDGKYLLKVHKDAHTPGVKGMMLKALILSETRKETRILGELSSKNLGPKPYAMGDNWVIMDLIHGETASDINRRAGKSAYVSELRRFESTLVHEGFLIEDAFMNFMYGTITRGEETIGPQWWRVDPLP